MPYKGLCQACFNENPKAEGRACGQTPLDYCDKHLLQTAEAIKEWLAGRYFPGEKWGPFLVEVEEEIKKRKLARLAEKTNALAP